MPDHSSAHPFCRADHIGSLLRPQALKDAHKALAKGEIDETAFAAVVDRAIAETVAMQDEVGLGVVTDGEFRRRSWFDGFVEAVDGLVHKPTKFEFVEDGEARVPVPVPYAEGPIRRSKGIATHELAFVAQLAHKPVKITMPAPSVIHFHRGPDCADPAVYPDMERYWDDLIAVYRAEIAALGAGGLSYLQLDEVPVALLCDPAVRERVAAWGWDWQALVERYISAVNEALAERPPGMTVGMHLCRGNYRGKWIASGGYEPVAERLFADAAVDQFLLEFDSARAGGFEPLRLVPKDKSVVLGLVSSKTPALEAADDLKRRIGEAAVHIPLERLALSPQCGFGTTVGGAPMGEDDQRRKLARVVEAARAVWG
jgi:5-methyltetrahydropteroyltriglutamate--homocysteine methyltransferase